MTTTPTNGAVSSVTTIRERARQALSRAEAATKGPWRECGADRGGCECSMVWSESADALVLMPARDPDNEGVTLPPEGEDKANARFSAHARTDVPDLAAFALRVTAPDTHDRIIDIVCDEQWAMDPHGCAAAIFALLTEESP